MSKPFERSIRTPPICTLLFKSWIMRIMGFSKAIKRMKNRRDEIVDLFVQMQNSFFVLLFYCFERKTHLLLFIWEYTFRKLIVRCDRRIFQIDINICLLHFCRNHPFLFSYWTNLKFLTFVPSQYYRKWKVYCGRIAPSQYYRNWSPCLKKFSAFLESFVFRYIFISKLLKCCFRQEP